MPVIIFVGVMIRGDGFSKTVTSLLNVVLERSYVCNNIMYIVYKKGDKTMAIKMVIGSAGSGKSHYCMDQLMVAEWQNKPLILLVPDQATYLAERRLAELAPEKGFMNIHVVGFSRLAYQVFDERYKNKISLSELAKRVILQQLVRRHHDDLKVLRMAAKQHNFGEILAQLIGECQSFCLSPLELQQAGEQSADTVLAAKLHDIALIYEAYTQFLTDRFDQSEDLFTLLKKEIPRSSLIASSQVWVDGFHWFTPQQLGVLRALGDTAADMTITLTIAPHQLKSQGAETALFHRPWTVYEKILEWYPKASILPLSSHPRYGRLSGLEQVVTGLEHNLLRPVEKPADGLTVVAATTRLLEVDYIARDMIRLCREGQYRWQDMLVLARSGETYADEIEQVFADYGIPYFSDRRRPMVEHPAAELISSLLDVLQSYWDYDPLFRLLKTDLVPLSRMDVDRLENYCLAYGIRGYQWDSPTDWHYYRRRSLDNDEPDDDKREEYLAYINGIRYQVATYIMPIMTQRQAQQPVRVWIEQVYQWLIDLDVPGTLRKWQKDAVEQADLTAGKEHEQVWKQIVHLFDELVELCGDELVGLDEFAPFLLDGLGDLTFSLIPPTLDHVTVTSVDRGYGLEKPIVFILGANSGVFPADSGDEGLFTDAERRRLAVSGLYLAPGSQFRTFQEKFFFYLACTRATERLTVSYALADTEGAVMEPSLAVRQLLAQHYVLAPAVAEPHIAVGTEGSYMVRLERSCRYLPLFFQRAQAGEPISDPWWALYDWALSQGTDVTTITRGLFRHNQSTLSTDMVKALYAPRGKFVGSVTRLETYQACPYKFYAAYGLKLMERPLFRLTPPDLGQLLHSSLRLLGEKLLKEQRQWRDLTSEEINAQCREITDELAPKVQNEIFSSNAYFSHLKERLDSTIVRTVERLRDFSSVSQFATVALEQSFGFGQGAWPALEISLSNGVELQVIGQIDRIDVYADNGRRCVFVVDYKSGNMKITAQEIYYGIKLQLLLYVYMTLLNMDGSPAGAAYCYVANRKITADRPESPEERAALYQNSVKLWGYYLKDAEVLQELDTSMDGYSMYLNIYLKDREKFRANAPSVKDESQWEAMLEQTIYKMTEAAERILSGDIAVKPLWIKGQTACRFCTYSSVCLFDAAQDRYRVLPELKEEEAMKRMMAERLGYHDVDDSTAGRY